MNDIVTTIRQILELGFPAVVLIQWYLMWQRNAALENKLMEWVDKCIEENEIIEGGPKP